MQSTRTLFQTVSKFGVGAMAAIALASSAVARAEHVRVTNPNAVSVEFLGRAMLYSVTFDRVVNDDIVAGVGFGSTSMRTIVGDLDPSISTGVIPVYANYYFVRDGGSPFITVGADIVTNSGNLSGLKSTFGGVEFSSTPVLATFGLGYEARTDAGFLFRVTGYGIYGSNLRPWGGLTLGYSF